MVSQTGKTWRHKGTGWCRSSRGFSLLNLKLTTPPPPPKFTTIGTRHLSPIHNLLKFLPVPIFNPSFSQSAYSAHSHPSFFYAKMAHGPVDPDQYTAPFQLTKGMYRDVYPAVDPKNEDLKATGKVVIITGAGGGLGEVGHLPPPFHILDTHRMLDRWPPRLGL